MEKSEGRAIIETTLLKQGISADLYKVKNIEKYTGFVCATGETHRPAYTFTIEFPASGISVKSTLWQKFSHLCAKNDNDIYKISFWYELRSLEMRDSILLALFAGCDPRSLEMRQTIANQAKEIEELKLQIEALELSPGPGKKYNATKKHFKDIVKGQS